MTGVCPARMARARGFLAGLNGRGEADCPHAADSARAFWWRDGLRAARAQRAAGESQAKADESFPVKHPGRGRGALGPRSEWDVHEITALRLACRGADPLSDAEIAAALCAGFGTRRTARAVQAMRHRHGLGMRAA